MQTGLSVNVLTVCTYTLNEYCLPAKIFRRKRHHRLQISYSPFNKACIRWT